MARLARLVIAGLPHTLLLRGHGTSAIVRDDSDRSALLRALHAAAGEQGVAIHAYAILDERLEALLTPSRRDALGQLVQSLGRSYVAAFNARHRVRGSLWEGRFRCGVIEAETWLLPCMLGIELAPVTAGLVPRAEAFRWSSAQHHLGMHADPLINDHACFWALGNTPFEREAAYRQCLEQGVATGQVEAIHHATLHGWALGSPAFVADVERAGARPARPRARGRPRKI